MFSPYIGDHRRSVRTTAEQRKTEQTLLTSESALISSR